MPPMAPIANPTDRRDRLDGAYVQVRDIILARQDPITGLLPASTAINAHGDYTDAWVRDNVYSIMCAWGLAMAMRREDYAESRAYLLEQSTVKLMRGLLTAMMKQSSKVERFKASLAATDALHAKYDTSTGDPVVGDGEWGHLQIDATSLFLLMLAQMTASGLRIVFTLAEVAFVQNLVHYIGRAYRIPDYGIWERGNKINHGITELNSSSIGMAKAAMEALSGFDLFGGGGGRASVIHVVPDEIARTRISLFSMLPRESGSKEVDAATLSVVGFPAFAVEDNELLQRTLDEVTEKLEGRYGCKRFLLDGHQTVLEDTGKLHYEPEELKAFENIECEWPLFFTYQLLNTLFLGDHEQASAYRAKLELCLADVDGQGLLPELYFVPMDKVEAEREHPHSQTRQPNENVPLVWAQSLYILGTLVHDGLLDLNDIDPLGRHRRVGRQAGRRVQIALLSSTPEVQEHLLARGIETETLEQIRPVELHQTEQLSLVYEQVGRNDKLGLSGRPFRHARALATSRVYELEGRRMLFLPLSLDRRGFYLAHDERMLVEQLKADLAYAHRHWDLPGRPLITILITESHLNDRYSEVLLDLVEALQQGRCEGVPVHVGRVSQLLPTTSKERIDELFGFHFPDSLPERGAAPTRHLPFESEQSQPIPLGRLTFWLESLPLDELRQRLIRSANPYEQIEILALLSEEGLDQPSGLSQADGTVSIRTALEELYDLAAREGLWDIVRRAAGLLDKFHIRLEEAVTEIVVSQRRLTLGRAYSRRATIHQPLSNSEILAAIDEFSGDDARERVMLQEIVLHLGMLIKAEPELFDGLITIRTGQILKLMITLVQWEHELDPDAAFDRLSAMAPYETSDLVRRGLAQSKDDSPESMARESLHVSPRSGSLTSGHFPETFGPQDLGEAATWREWRELRGSISRLQEDFYAGIWELLSHCRGLVIGDKYNRKRRLDSEQILAETTREEKNFALVVDHLLNKIQSPEYRQLTIETLIALISVFRDNPDLYIDDTLIIDVIIGHAVRLRWLDRNPHRPMGYDHYVTQAWTEFYLRPPHEVANASADALAYLLDDTNHANTPEPDKAVDAPLP